MRNDEDLYAPPHENVRHAAASMYPCHERLGRLAGAGASGAATETRRGAQWPRTTVTARIPEAFAALPQQGQPAGRREQRLVIVQIES
jgi:hypothetical protein